MEIIRVCRDGWTNHGAKFLARVGCDARIDLNVLMSGDIIDTNIHSSARPAIVPDGRTF
jgi:hypothetical protein